MNIDRASLIVKPKRKYCFSFDRKWNGGTLTARVLLGQLFYLVLAVSTMGFPIDNMFLQTNFTTVFHL